MTRSSRILGPPLPAASRCRPLALLCCLLTLLAGVDSRLVFPLLAGGTASASSNVPPSQQDEDDDDTFNVADSEAPVPAPRRDGRLPCLTRLPSRAAPAPRPLPPAPQRPLTPPRAGAWARHNGIGAPLLC